MDTQNKTNWVPWVVGGAAALGIGYMAYKLLAPKTTPDSDAISALKASYYNSILSQYGEAAAAAFKAKVANMTDKSSIDAVYQSLSLSDENYQGLINMYGQDAAAAYNIRTAGVTDVTVLNQTYQAVGLIYTYKTVLTAYSPQAWTTFLAQTANTISISTINAAYTTIANQYVGIPSGATIDSLAAALAAKDKPSPYWPGYWAVAASDFKLITTGMTDITQVYLIYQEMMSAFGFYDLGIPPICAQLESLFTIGGTVTSTISPATLSNVNLQNVWVQRSGVWYGFSPAGLGTNPIDPSINLFSLANGDAVQIQVVQSCKLTYANLSWNLVAGWNNITWKLH